MQTAKWFEQPDGTFRHGVEVPPTYVTFYDHIGKYGWFGSFRDARGSGFKNREDAILDAERAIRERLTEAVAAMGGHVVWTKSNGSGS